MDRVVYARKLQRTYYEVAITVEHKRTGSAELPVLFNESLMYFNDMCFLLETIATFEIADNSANLTS